MAVNKRVAGVLAVLLLAPGAGRADSQWRRRIVDLTRLEAAGTVRTGLARSFSADGSAFAVYETSLVHLHDARDGRRLRTLAGHEALVHDSCWSRDGRLVATTAFDETVRVWEVATGKQRFAVRPFPSFACSVAFSPDGRRLAAGSGSDGLLKILDAVTGATLDALQTNDSALFAMEYTPDGRFLVVNHSPAPRTEPSLRVYRTSDLSVVKTAVEGTAGGFAASADGSCFAYGNAAGDVVLMETSAWTETLRIPTDIGVATSMAFHPDGRHLASTGTCGTVRIWETAAGKTVKSLPTGANGMARLSFGSDGETLVVGPSDGTVRIFGRRWPVSAAPQPPPQDGAPGK